MLRLRAARWYVSSGEGVVWRQTGGVGEEKVGCHGGSAAEAGDAALDKCRHFLELVFFFWCEEEPDWSAGAHGLVEGVSHQ